MPLLMLIVSVMIYGGMAACERTSYRKEPFSDADLEYLRRASLGKSAADMRRMYHNFKR